MILYVDKIPVEVQRRRKKNLSLYVKAPEGTVLVTAPYGVSDREIEAFVTAKASWIRKHVARMQRSRQRAERELVTGEIISVWGTDYDLEVRSGSRYGISLVEGNETLSDVPKAIMTVREDDDKEKRKACLDRFYKNQLKERVEELLPQWEERTGLHCSGWSQRTMKTRWGSCNTRTNHLNFNTRLAEYPSVCLEYVILHELAHTKVPNHGPEFKAIEDNFMPDWRQVRNLLNHPEDN